MAGTSSGLDFLSVTATNLLASLIKIKELVTVCTNRRQQFSPGDLFGHCQIYIGLDLKRMAFMLGPGLEPNGVKKVAGQTWHRDGIIFNPTGGTLL